MNGAFDYNSLHLHHCNISSIDLDINGSSVSALKGAFPNEVAQMFHNTLNNLINHNNLLSLQSFVDGRTINVWNLKTSLCEDVLNIEKGGNVRINMQRNSPLNDNFVVMVIGITTGVFEIDSMRRVKTSFVI